MDYTASSKVCFRCGSCIGVFIFIKNFFPLKQIWKTPGDNRRPQWIWGWSPSVLGSFWWPSDLQLGWNSWSLWFCWWQWWQDLPFKGWLYPVPLQKTGKHLVSLPCVFYTINQHSLWLFLWSTGISKGIYTAFNVDSFSELNRNRF